MRDATGFQNTKPAPGLIFDRKKIPESDARATVNPGAGTPALRRRIFGQLLRCSRPCRRSAATGRCFHRPPIGASHTFSRSKGFAVPTRRLLGHMRTSAEIPPAFRRVCTGDSAQPSREDSSLYGSFWA